MMNRPKHHRLWSAWRNRKSQLPLKAADKLILIYIILFSIHDGMKNESGTKGRWMDNLFSHKTFLFGADISKVPLPFILIDGEIDGFKHKYGLLF